MKLSKKDLALNQSTINLLRAIEQGTQVFAPTIPTKESLAEFQETVNLLRKMESYKYLAEISSLNLVNSEGEIQIDRVRVKGSLTEKGHAVLAHYDDILSAAEDQIREAG